MASQNEKPDSKKPYSSPSLTIYGDFKKLTLGSNSTKKTDVSGRVTKSSVVA
jgi:hypothetical protein